MKNKPPSVSPPPLILASGSKARRQILEQAGLTFDVVPAAIDEGALLTALADKVAVTGIAQTLAEKKARAVAKDYPAALVIGGDQILVFEGKIFTKPATRAEALENLMALAGKTHQLISAAAVVQGDEILWTTAQSVRLTMKEFDQDALSRYLVQSGEAVLNTVGSYELEGLGSWLFEAIDGDYFTVLGLPLLSLLSFLHAYGFGPTTQKL